jgi:hypothetical protein
MADIKTIGIKDLKNNLSAHLREVRRGAKILVSDRSRVVAELHEPTSEYSHLETQDPVVGEWLREGAVLPPSGNKAPLPASPIQLKEGTARRLLDQGRDETRR